MRKNKVVLPLLVMLLLIGGGVGAWFVVQDASRGTGPNISRNEDTNEDDSREDPGLIGVDPNGGHEDETPPEKTPGPNGDPANKQNTTGNHETSTNGNETTGPGKQPVESTWESRNYELTITGRVRFKSDGRPAVGASVHAEPAQDDSFTWRRDAVAEVDGEPERPEVEIVGEETATDGAGEFALRVKVTTWVRPGDNTPAERRREREFVRAMPQGIAVVATMPGYAPARSTAIYPRADSPPHVELHLAVPTVLRGRVINVETGEAIAGALGSLRDLESAGSGMAVRVFETDEEGYFSLSDLPAGTYMLNISAGGYVTWRSWQETGRLNLKPGEERDMGDIALGRMSTIIGVVVDGKSGEPVAGANVTAENRATWTGADSGSATDAEGAFKIEGMNPGTYTIKVRADGYAQGALDAQTVGSGKTLDVGTIKLGAGLTIHGRVADGRGDPVADAVVAVKEPREGFNFGPQASLQSTGTDESGEYTLSGLREGTFVLVVTAAGYAEFNEALKITGEAQRVDVTLQVGGTVTGRALHADGTPAGEANVAVVSHNSQAYALYKMQPGSVGGMAIWAGDVTGKCDEDGRFELANVPAGDYLIVCSLDQFDTRRDNLKVSNDETLDVGELRFAGTGALRVIVTDDGRYVPDIEVSLNEGRAFGGGGTHRAVTGSTGTALIEDVPAGTYYVVTDRDGTSFDTDRAARRVTVKAGETVEFRLELRPADGIHLHGRLTMNGKAILESVTLVGKGDRDGIVKAAETEQGYYEFTGLKPGHYTLYARENDTTVACRADLNLAGDGEHPFDRDFMGYSVGGTVTTPDNTPAQVTATQLILKALDDDSEFSAWLSGRDSPAGDGVFEFNNVPAGRYRLTATLAGVGSVATEVNVVSGGVTGLKLSIAENSGTVKVTIAKLNGSAVGGGGFAGIKLTDSRGEVHEFADPQQSVIMMLNPGATVTVNTVAPGTWTVEVRASGFVPHSVKDVRVSKGEVTEVEVELTAAAALFVTCDNSEITQEMLDDAGVRYFNAEGSEVAVESNAFDSWAGGGEVYEVPTLAVRYIGMDVAEVRVKLAGYAELVIPVEPQPGKKIERRETFVLE